MDSKPADPKTNNIESRLTGIETTPKSNNQSRDNTHMADKPVQQTNSGLANKQSNNDPPKPIAKVILVVGNAARHLSPLAQPILTSNTTTSATSTNRSSISTLGSQAIPAITHLEVTSTPQQENTSTNQPRTDTSVDKQHSGQPENEDDESDEVINSSPFPDDQKVWFLYCLGIARERNKQIDKDNLPKRVYDSFVGVVEELKHFKPLSRVPTPKALRAMWTRFIVEGRIAKIKSGGRKIREEPRKQISELLKGGDLSFRKIAKQVGCSTSLVSNYAKSIAERPHNPSPNKTTKTPKKSPKQNNTNRKQSNSKQVTKSTTH